MGAEQWCVGKPALWKKQPWSLAPANPHAVNTPIWLTSSYHRLNNSLQSSYLIIGSGESIKLAPVCQGMDATDNPIFHKLSARWNLGWFRSSSLSDRLAECWLHGQEASSLISRGETRIKCGFKNPALLDKVQPCEPITKLSNLSRPAQT